MGKVRSICKLLLYALFVLGGIDAASTKAAEPTTVGSDVAPSKVSAPTTSGTDQYTISAVTTSRQEDERYVLARGETISIRIDNFNKLVDATPKKAKDSLVPELVLFINHLPVTGLPPVYADPVTQTVKYDLRRTADTSGFWTNIYRDWRWLGPTKEDVSIGVGPDAAHELARTKQDAPAVAFQFVSWIRYWTYLISCAVLALVLWGVWKRHPGASRIIRDNGTVGRDAAGELRMAPYSLSRCQMAFWFLLVSFSATFILVATGDLPAIPSGLVGMMGISSLTTIGGTAVATMKDQGTQQYSRGFGRDLLCDANGALGLQRVQFAAWTCILGTVALQSLLADLAISDFQPTTLVLIGISSGTYVGLKVPENK